MCPEIYLISLACPIIRYISEYRSNSFIITILWSLFWPSGNVIMWNPKYRFLFISFFSNYTCKDLHSFYFPTIKYFFWSRYIHSATCCKHWISSHVWSYNLIWSFVLVRSPRRSRSPPRRRYWVLPTMWWWCFRMQELLVGFRLFAWPPTVVWLSILARLLFSVDDCDSSVAL